MKSIILILCFASACYCEFSDSPRNFSIELLYHTQAETDGHIVISPFGIWTLMTGVALGAVGDSLKQIRYAFRLTSNKSALLTGYKTLTKTVLDPDTTGVILTSKNFLFLDDGFTIDSSFRKVITNDFDASLKILDFGDSNSAARIANNYIQNSGARVSNVLTSDDFVESRMILTNTITFKGRWTFPFNKTDTKSEPFYDENRKAIGNVNMMYQRAQFPFSNIEKLGAYALELPYGNDGKYSMLVLLPHGGVKIEKMYRNFTEVTLPDVLKKLQADVDEFGLEDVDVKIPRFKISTNVILNKPLNRMGVIDIFEPRLANFKRVTDEKIFVSAIVHKADIEVTETGTIASASTSANFADRISTPSFHANRPFVYFIIEKTSTTVIFGGVYSKATAY